MLNLILLAIAQTQLTDPIVGTNLHECYGTRSVIASPRKGEAFYRQDAQLAQTEPSYTALSDGTVKDNVTGLIWQKTPGPKVTWKEAYDQVKACRVGGYSDWRMPTIKELYSLIEFSGLDPSSLRSAKGSKPFIDTRYFDFQMGNTTRGERVIDSQYWSSTMYVGKTMGGDPTAFGVNFADGRIKGYGFGNAIHRKVTAYVRYVRGPKTYGINKFVKGPRGTVVDLATGLMWQQADSGKGMNWVQALSYAENLHLAGYADWHLPTAKELQSIVDYTRSNQTTKTASIDPLFRCTAIKLPNGEMNWPYYWTSTTHVMSPKIGVEAAYIAFGDAKGYMQFPWQDTATYMDVHGAGAQRSDPKSGTPSPEFYGRGPQGDDIRINNYVRCVRQCSDADLTHPRR